MADLQQKPGSLAKLCLLILDEFGCVCSSKAGTELLFEVVSRAYERQRTLLTMHISASVGHRKRPLAATKFGWTRPVISGGATTDLKDLLVLPSDHRAKLR